MFIEEIRDTQKCVGCSNCKNACPVQAIDMIEDKEGFLVPNINHDKCVNCGKCEKVCPNHQLKYRDVESLPEVRLVRTKNEDLLKETASGGICTVLSNYFVRKKNGYVCGALYDDNFRVIHTLTNSLTDIERMRQSKYVQSDLGSCFSDIETKLRSGVYVLFIGTGCQVYALKKYLNKDYDTLFCIDLICHGVPSPKVQREYVAYLQAKYGEIKHINNRYKKTYTHSYVSTYFTEYKTGRKVVKRYSDDPMADAFFSHLSIRPSCFDCAFKTLHRLSDLTIGDFWFSEQYGFGEDLLGINLCLIQSGKGEELLNSIQSQTEMRQIDAKDAILLNGGMLYSSCPVNKNRTAFFKELETIPLDYLVRKYDGKSITNRLKNRIRELIAPVLRSTKYYNKQLVKSARSRVKRTIPEEKKGMLYY